MVQMFKQMMGMLIAFSTVSILYGISWETGGCNLTVPEFATNLSVRSSPYSLIGEGPDEEFGYNLAGGGDLNGDGLSDLAITAPLHSTSEISLAGKVYIYFGGSFETDRPNNRTEEDASFVGMKEYDDLGTSLSINGDLNGDGLDDLVIEDYYAPGSYYGSSVHIVFGKRSGWSRDLNISSSDVMISYPSMGLVIWTVESGGDLNGDGLDDLVISLPYDTDYFGKVFIFFGKDSGWTNMNLTDADTIIKDQEMGTRFGVDLGISSDLNDDGINDLVIGASQADHGGMERGSAYLFFGRRSWPQTISTSEVNVTFDGECDNGMAGYDIATGGDVNNDGISDLLIGAPLALDQFGLKVGRSYLMFGKTAGWTSKMDLSDSDVIITGSDVFTYFSLPSCFLGDVNGDGSDDILICSIYSGDENSNQGKVYLFYGRNGNWPNDLNPVTVDVSFVGENSMDRLGHSCQSLEVVEGTCQISGFAISSPFNDEGGTDCGKVYLFMQQRNDPPKEISSVDLFSDQDCTDPMTRADKGDTVIIKLRGVDGNTSSRDVTFVNVTLNRTMIVPRKVSLRETGTNTGVYLGSFLVPVNSEYKEMLTTVSVIDPTRLDSLVIDTPILLNDCPDKILLKEGDTLRLSYENVGYSIEEEWSMETDAGWIKFDASDRIISGTPFNKDVGKWNIKVILTDGKGHTDSALTTVNVINVPPVIITSDVWNAVEDLPYIVDYSCNEDLEGDMVWGLATNASFLEMISDAGILRGTPTNGDVGVYWVRVWVDDGNGEKTSTEFNLTVTNVNDPPTITSRDMTKVDQGSRYWNTYEVEDPDKGDTLTWTLDTVAKWLSLDGPVLSGIPGPNDVGTFHVTITVSDKTGASDQRSFNLEVVNVNDPPVWTNVPDDISISNGKELRFDVNATDADTGTDLIYSISSLPYTDISIDRSSGLITWSASIDFFERPPYLANVKVKVTDGKVTIDHDFKVTIHLSDPPTSSLVSPSDGAKVPFKGSFLEWSASDPDNDDLTFDIYMGENKAFVSVLNEEASFLRKYNGTRLEITGLEQGKTYYWTVIPFDSSSYGTCSDNIRSFRLNSPPLFKDVEGQQIKANHEFRMIMKVTDNDPEDKGNLRFSLEGAPTGMSIDEDIGMILWTPADDQVMLYKVKVIVKDSTETSDILLTIEVLEGDQTATKDKGMMIILAASVLMLIGFCSIIILLVVRKIKGTVEGGNYAENSEQIDERTERYNRLCSVALDANEAHRYDHLSKAPKTYEELYGCPAPVKEDFGANLRDCIKETIEELEGIKV